MRRISSPCRPTMVPGSRRSAAGPRAAWSGAVILAATLLGLPLRAGETPDAPDQGTVVVPAGQVWRFFRGTQDPPADWSQPAFDDSGWEAGPTGIGYGDGDDATVLEDMRCTPVDGVGEDKPCAGGGYLAFFARTSFEAPAVPDGQRLLARVSYDDGFVLYLNGIEVARVNMPDGPITRETPARTTIGDAPSSPDAVIAIAKELLRDGRNVLAASVHNARLTSSDASFVPRLLVSPAEPPHEPSCQDRCAARAAEAFQACLAEGGGEDSCHAKKTAVLEECLKAECDVPPPPNPTCESRCEEAALKAFKLCREEGGGEDACHTRSQAALRECLAACDEKPPERPCAEECAASGNAVFEACLAAGGNREDCRRKADGIVALCLERCGAGTPCEDACAVAAQIVLTGCNLAHLPEGDCKAMANSVLERCVAGCAPPVPCESGCDALAQRAVEECKARGGPEEECAAAGAGVLKECLAHCDGKPVPDCDLQCEAKAADVFKHCVAEGQEEAVCRAKSEDFLANCKAELSEVCDQEKAALQSSFQLFLRGDSNGDATVDLSDAVAILGYLFLGNAAPPCEDAADSNDDGTVNIADAVNLLGALFLGGGPLPEPYGRRGQDPTSDLLLCTF